MFIFCPLMVAHWSACLSRHWVVYPLFSFMWRVQGPGYIDVCSDLVRDYTCSILLPTMWWKILYSLSSLIAVADGRVLVVCYFFFWLLIVVENGRNFDCLTQL